MSLKNNLVEEYGWLTQVGLHSSYKALTDKKKILVLHLEGFSIRK